MTTDKFTAIANAKERVAFELMEKIFNDEYEKGQKLDRVKILDLYAECLHAASGNRKYPGKP